MSEDISSATGADQAPADDIELVGRVIAAVPGWIYWRWKQQPILLTTAAAMVIGCTSWAVETIPALLGIRDDQLPFATQAQHAEALCLIGQVGHSACSLLVAVGQAAEGSCAEPPVCITPGP